MDEWNCFLLGLQRSGLLLTDNENVLVWYWDVSSRKVNAKKAYREFFLVR